MIRFTYSERLSAAISLPQALHGNLPAWYSQSAVDSGAFPTWPVRYSRLRTFQITFEFCLCCFLLFGIPLRYEI